MLGQQRAQEGHCPEKGLSWFLCAGFRFFLLLLVWSAGWVIGTASSSLALRDLKSPAPAPAPAQASDHLPTALLTQIPYDPDSMPTMVSQVPVCTHITALAWLHPRELFSAYPTTMDPLKPGQPRKRGELSPELNHIFTNDVWTPVLGRTPIPSLSFLLAFFLYLFSYSLISA